jgi:hypothetical protein
VEIIFRKLIRKKVIELIELIGININELVLDIQLSEMTINTIEWIPSEDVLLVHVFQDDLDFFYDFDELLEVDRLLILTTLSFY